MKKAVYAGSFDPITNGHVDIIKRASKLFSELYILVTENIGKSPTFTTLERMNMIRKVITCDNVHIDSTNDLVVKFAKEKGATTMVRGLRNISDFESEIALYHFNKHIDKEIETIILFPSHRHTYLSSSAVKELIYYGADISPYVPKVLIEEITEGVKKAFMKKNKSLVK
ncbi:MAG: pantetheine-phosphate adenylyltransferase [Acholeplasmatales bacterium]